MVCGAVALAVVLMLAAAGDSHSDCVDETPTPGPLPTGIGGPLLLPSLTPTAPVSPVATPSVRGTLGRVCRWRVYLPVITRFDGGEQ